MKKTLLALVLILSMLFTFTACNTDYSTFNTIWNDYEEFNYKVYNVKKNSDNKETETEIGTYKTSVERINNQEVTINGETFKDVVGSLIKNDLKINNSSDYVKSEILINTELKVQYAYKEFKKDDKVYKIVSRDDGKNYKSTITEGDKKTETSISVQSGLLIKAPIIYYNNEIMPIVLRSFDIANSKFTLSINVPFPLENKMQARKISRSKNTDYNEIIMGLSNTLNIPVKVFRFYFEKSPQEKDGVTVKNILKQFDENDTRYRLDSFEVKKPSPKDTTVKDTENDKQVDKDSKTETNKDTNTETDKDSKTEDNK